MSHGESKINMNRAKDGNQNNCKLKQDSMFYLLVLNIAEEALKSAISFIAGKSDVLFL